MRRSYPIVIGAALLVGVGAYMDVTAWRRSADVVLEPSAEASRTVAELHEDNAGLRQRIAVLAENQQQIDASLAATNAGKVAIAERERRVFAGTPWQAPALNRHERISTRAEVEYDYAQLADLYALAGAERQRFFDILTEMKLRTLARSKELRLRGASAQESQVEMVKVWQDVRAAMLEQMDFFLNDGGDSEYFRFYEDSAQDRMRVESLATAAEQMGEPLSRERQQEVVSAAYEARKGHVSSVGREIHSEADLQAAAQDMAALNAEVLAAVSGLLSPTQLAVYRQSLDTETQMILNALRDRAGVPGN